MNYNPTLYTHPIPFTPTTTTELPVPVGDSYFITLMECEAPEINFTSSRGDIQQGNVIRNTLYLSEMHHSVAYVGQEGTDITLTVKTSENVTQDVTIDWTITHGGVFHNSELVNSKANIGHFDYTALHRDTQDTDFALLTGQVMIPQGSNEITFTVSTVDDLLWTGGINTYKLATITLSNVSDTNLLTDRMQALIMLEDNATTPVFEGEVELWVRMGDSDDCHLEPLGGRSDAVTFSIGYDDNGDSLLETSIFDDVDIRSIAFRTNIAPIAPNGEDATNSVFYYKAQIKSGRRYE